MKTYKVEGMTCASCAASAQKVLGRMQGVKEARVNYATKTAAVELEDQCELNIEAMNGKLEKMGYKLYPNTKDADKKRHEHEAKNLQELQHQLIWGGFFATPLFVIAMFFHHLHHGNYIMFGLTLPILLWSGNRFFISAAKQITVGKVNMDSLVALGTGTAFVFSTFNTFFPQVLEAQGLQPHVYFEAVGVLLVFILLGKYLEAKASQQTSSAIEELMALQVPTVQIIENGVEKTFPVEVVQVGDILKVRPGDTIPLDGEIIEGEAKINESMLTGEALPVSKNIGQTVFSGTILQQGSILLKVSKIGSETVLSQIIQLVEEAQNTQVPVQKLVDKIAAVFVPIVMLIALITLVVWFFVGLYVEGVVAAVAVLVVACPCALGLATPTAIMVGLGEAAKKGILIRNVEAIEHSAKIDAVVLDKTGTITEGSPQLTAIYWQKELGDNISEFEKIALALENESEHPIAQTFVKYYATKNILPAIRIENFLNHTGLGISGVVEGKTYWLGNEKLLQTQKISIPTDIQQAVQNFQKQAQTLAFFAKEQEVIAVLAFSDTIKNSSVTAISNLQKVGKQVYMLTGDNEAVAQYTAQQVGIKDYKANVLPQDKIAFVQTLQKEGKTVMMVGDGINDAPALAQANVGVAMNNGTSVAISSADVVLRRNDLAQLAEMVSISQRMLRVIRQNLFWAFIYNIILIPVAAGVLYPYGILLNPMIAGGAMALSSVFVVMNSLRLKW